MNQSETKKTIDIAIKEYKGDLTHLESAIGAFLLGQKVGWKVLFLAHDRRTIKRFEKILKVDFRKELPEDGVWAHKSYAWKALKKITNFWKAVKGEVSIERKQELD